MFLLALLSVLSFSPIFLNEVEGQTTSSAASPTPTSASRPANCSVLCDLCASNGTCRKCADQDRKLLLPQTDCVLDCPGTAGFRVAFAPDPYQGKICKQMAPTGPTQKSGTLTSPPATSPPGGKGLSNVIIGVIAGVVGGLVFALVVALIAVYIFHSRREAVLSDQAAHISMQHIQRAPSNQTPARRPPALSHEQRSYEALNESGPESPRAMPDEERIKMEAEFREKLDGLRPKAEKILEMLNATNKRRKSTQNKEEMNRLKLAMDDISTVLRLIHKKPEKIYIPAGGVQLLEWVEKLLISYTASQKQKEEEGEETHF